MWDDPMEPSEEIVVYAGGDEGGGIYGDDKLGVKMGAARMRDTINNGGTILVVVGGVTFLAGGATAGYTWWTGAGGMAGGGLMAAGAVIAGVGGAAWWVGSLLDDIVRDPPQPNYTDRIELRPASFVTGVQNAMPNDPLERMVLHLRVMATLGPGLLNAVERRAGAALANDATWVARWDDAVARLRHELAARAVSLGAACEDMANLPCVDGYFDQDALNEGLGHMQGKTGAEIRDLLAKQMRLEPQILAMMERRIAGLHRRALPHSVDLRDMFASTGAGLKAAGLDYLQS